MSTDYLFIDHRNEKHDKNNDMDNQLLRDTIVNSKLQIHGGLVGFFGVKFMKNEKGVVKV